MSQTRLAFILFVDMLGFAALVEEEGEDVDELEPIYTDDEVYANSPAPNLLSYRFANFHRCLNQARSRLQRLSGGTAIVFSDSAFFALDDVATAVQFARELMLDLVSNDVPTRMGLAQGSYRTLRVLTDSSTNVAVHTSQFLGTGVVRAYQTERCGVAGLRILLHPTIEPLVDRELLRVVPVTSGRALRLDVLSEVNYLEAHQPNSLGPDYEDCIQFDCLRRMAAYADEKFHYHYIDTFHAWNTMRAQLGRPPYPWEKFLDRDEYDRTHGVHERLAALMRRT
jgi:hypothetical protein